MQKTENNETNQHFKLLIDKYATLLFRISYCVLCNKDDAEDAVQETFLRYLIKMPEFSSEEHEKAWLIKVVANISKNVIKLRLRRNVVPFDELSEIGVNDKDSEIFELVLNLPSKYNLVLILYYIEGYKTKEISDILNISEDTARKRLQKGRELLKKEFERCELI